MNPTTDLTAPDIGRSTCMAAWLLGAGAVLLLVGNATHPIDAAPSPASRLELATAGSWMLIHLVIAAGLLAVVVGLVVLAGTITTGGARLWARIGATAGMLGGLCLIVVFAAIDGYGYARLARLDGTSAGLGELDLAAVSVTLDLLDSGLTALGILVFFGLTFTAYGLALLASRLLGRVIGAVALVLGALGLVTGAAFAAVGPTALVINALFRPLALGVTAYLVVLAVALRRLPGPSAPAGVRSPATYDRSSDTLRHGA